MSRFACNFKIFKKNETLSEFASCKNNMNCKEHKHLRCSECVIAKATKMIIDNTPGQSISIKFYCDRHGNS
jgi:hypothetical protein